MIEELGGNTLYFKKDGNYVELEISTGTGCDLGLTMSQADALLLRDFLNSFINITQKFAREIQRFFVFRHKETGLYIREGEKLWTINIELAHIYIATEDQAAYEFGPELARIEDIAILEVIPKLNGTVSINIKGDKA